MRILWTSSGPSARRTRAGALVHGGQGQVARHSGAAPYLDSSVDDTVVSGRHEHLDGRDVGAGVAAGGHHLREWIVISRAA